MRYKARNQFVIGLAVLLWCPLVGTDLPAPKFKRIDTTNGLPHNTVFCIVQDAYGFMWFGTRYGLARFDGHQFMTFNSTNSVLANHTVRDLVPKNDSLYYLATEGGLYLLNVRTNQINACPTTEGFLSSRIVDLAKDRKERLWIVTEGSGIYRLAADSLSNYKQPEYAVSVTCVSDGRVYINAAGESSGLFVFDEAADRFELISEAGFQPMTVIEVDSATLWIGTQGDGIFRLKPGGALERMFVVGNSRNANITRALLDGGEELIAATEGGLVMIDKETGRQRHYTYSPADRDGIADNALYSLFKDDQGGIWIGSYFRGISYIPPQANPFESYPLGLPSPANRGAAISSFFEWTDDQVLVTSEDRGISVFHPRTRSFSAFPAGDLLSYNNVHDICLDEKGNTWVGMYLHGIDVLHADRSAKTRITSEVGESIHSNSILRLLRDRMGNIHVGTVLGASVYDFHQQRLVRQEITHAAVIRDILEDSHGAIWYVSMNRGVFRYQPETGRWSVFNQKTAQVPSDKFVCAREDQHGVIWLGTEGFGLLKFDYRLNRFEVIDTENGLPNNYIFSVECAGDYLWIGTTDGLCRYNPETGSVKVYTEEDGLTDRYFNYNASRKMGNGELYFGTVNGFFKFDPAKIDRQLMLPPVYITSVTAANRQQETVFEQHDFSLLTSGKAQIVLPYRHNNVHIAFTALDYSQPAKTIYRYILEGFESRWNERTGQLAVEYGNLPPGNYVFKLLVSNGDDVWLEHPVPLRVLVKKPIWLSMWAWLLYAVLIGLLFVAVVRYVRQREKQRYQRLEEQRRQETVAAKMNFFTNLTHEIKTPLSLLKVPIEVFKDDTEFPDRHRNTLTIMDKNASWLEGLVNELLEFQKIGEAQYELKIVRTDLIALLRNLVERFNSYAKRYEIALLFRTTMQQPVMVEIDPQAVLKAISNLLVNALKYTKSRVVLSVRSDADPNMLRIAVHDNGSGIQPAYLARIFEPFTQFGQAKQFKGVGIGLAFAKSLIELHHGSLALRSTPGRWCVATIRLPKSSGQHLVIPIETETAPIDFRELAFSLPDVVPDTDLPEGRLDSDSSERAHILVVEDTVEIAYTTVSYLKAHYRVGYCKNGESALTYINKFQPDMVLSDVIMPEKDGVELCRQIKRNPLTSHIQVVLLTAKTTVDDRLVGLEVGADAYITKPFLLKEVGLTIKNLLQLRAALSQQVLSGDLQAVEKLEGKLAAHDAAFIRTVAGVVQDNLDNTDFKTDDLAEHLGMSKTLVYIKLKKLLGMSPNEYLLHIRFERAKALLLQAELTVAEIAYQVGFSDPNYFSRAFKQHVGKTPTAYRKNNHCVNIKSQR